MVISELLKACADMMYGVDNHLFESRLIVRTVLGLDSIDLVLEKNKEVSDVDIKKIYDCISRRLSGEPVQYILNSQEFMGLDFYVDQNVLIPRQDTETLVEVVLEQIKNKGATILDIGCGSGCIGISLAHFNKNVYLRSIDISQKAIDIATKNAENLGVSARATFEKCDIMSDKIPGKYDVIVSNPPYIKTDDIASLMREVKSFEPHTALDGGLDGLDFYRKIISVALTLLNENGILAFEVGFDQSGEVCSLMEKDFCNIQIFKDLCGVCRVVLGNLKQ